MKYVIVAVLSAFFGALFGMVIDGKGFVQNWIRSEDKTCSLVLSTEVVGDEYDRAVWGEKNVLTKQDLAKMLGFGENVKAAELYCTGKLGLR